MFPLIRKTEYLRGERIHAPEERKIEIDEELKQLKIEKEQINIKLEEQIQEQIQEQKEKYEQLENREKEIDEEFKQLESSLKNISDTFQEEIDMEQKIISDVKESMNNIKTKEELQQVLAELIPFYKETINDSDSVEYIMPLFVNKFFELNPEYKEFFELIQKFDRYSLKDTS